MAAALLYQMVGPQTPVHKEKQEKGLSEREREVLKYLSLGHTNQEIAEILHISVKTVETYKTRVMEKLDLRKRAELVRYAMENGIINGKKVPLGVKRKYSCSVCMALRRLCFLDDRKIT